MSDATDEQVISVALKRMAEPDGKAIQELLGLSPVFMDDLRHESSDWAFVVKLAVVVEAALTQSISSGFDSPALKAHLMRLPMDGRAGKIQLSQDMGITGKKGAGRLRAIASIRNAYAHDVSVIDVPLKSYIDALSKAESKALGASLLGVDWLQKKFSASDFPGDSARSVIWVSACLTLLELGAACRRNWETQQWRDAKITLGEALLAQAQGAKEVHTSKVQEALSLLEQVVKGSR